LPAKPDREASRSCWTLRDFLGSTGFRNCASAVRTRSGPLQRLRRPLLFGSRNFTPEAKRARLQRSTRGKPECPTMTTNTGRCGAYYRAACYWFCRSSQCCMYRLITASNRRSPVFRSPFRGRGRSALESPCRLLSPNRERTIDRKPLSPALATETTDLSRPFVPTFNNVL
jgi:hypothetical protein